LIPILLLNILFTVILISDSGARAGGGGGKADQPREYLTHASGIRNNTYHASRVEKKIGFVMCENAKSCD
jgi:hypothetical protein